MALLSFLCNGWCGFIDALILLIFIDSNSSSCLELNLTGVAVIDMISAQPLPARLGGVGRLMSDRLAGQSTNTNAKRNAHSFIFLVKGLDRYFTVVRYLFAILVAAFWLFGSNFNCCAEKARSRGCCGRACPRRTASARKAWLLRPFRLRPAWLLRRRRRGTSLATAAAAARLLLCR